jgi:ABC-2 type transport system permease protein
LPVVAATFVIMLFGPSLDLPGIIEGLSVFAHVPKNPAQVIPVVPLVALCGISVALALTSLVGIKRRDIA